MSEWISVRDRLPEKDEDILAYAPQQGIFSTQLTLSNNWICNCLCQDGSFLNHVTHWMPLPEPPREGK